MLDYLIKFDRLAASGILARAALALDSDDPASESSPALAGEMQVRKAIYEEARRFAKTTEGMSEWIVDQIERFDDAGSDAESAALLRLAEHGTLPGDAYEVGFSPEFDARPVPVIGDHEDARLAIARPDMSTDFGLYDDRVPTMTNISGRWIDRPGAKFPHFVVVIAEKKELKMNVRLIWRILPNKVALGTCRSAIEAYDLFCRVFGFTFTVADWRGRFLLFKRLRRTPSKDQMLIEGPNPLDYDFLITPIIKTTEYHIDISFASMINVTKYRRALSRARVV